MADEPEQPDPDPAEGEVDPETSRRLFLNWALGVSLAAAGGAMAYPVCRYLVPPEGAEGKPSSVVAARKDELSPGTAKIFKFGTKPGLLVRLEDGTYRAYAATCTHLDCTVQYKADERLIWCACHDGRYDLAGRNVSGPPPTPLPTYKVVERGDDIVVAKEA